MKIDLHTIKKPKSFFSVEKNTINNKYMVFSPYLQLPQCFFCDTKSLANILCNKLNEQANTEYPAYFIT